MSLHKLTDYAATLVQNQPEPPRRFPRQVLWYIVQDVYMLGGFLFGMGMIGGALWLIEYRQAWQSPVHLIWYGVVIGTGVVIATTPLRQISKWYLGLSHGRVAWAEATKVQPIGRFAVTGEWVVQLPERRIVAGFAITASWAPALRAGSRFRVLLHPTRPKILVPVGP